jgi:hypothetical protein
MPVNCQRLWSRETCHYKEITKVEGRRDGNQKMSEIGDMGGERWGLVLVIVESLYH